MLVLVRPSVRCWHQTDQSAGPDDVCSLGNSGSDRRFVKPTRLARTGPVGPVWRCPLIGVDPKSQTQGHNGAFYPERTSQLNSVTAAVSTANPEPIADNHRRRHPGQLGNNERSPFRSSPWWRSRPSCDTKSTCALARNFHTQCARTLARMRR